jgi:hypothetical protein
MKAVRFALAGCLALLVAACLPVTTKNPVGTTAGFQADPALVGLWKGHGDDPDGDLRDGYFAFLRNDDGTMTCILITPDKSSDEWGTFAVQTAALGGYRYMNVHGGLKNGKPDDDQLAKENILLRYSIGADGKLTLALLDDKATAEAVKAGRIAGVIEPGSMGDVRITADSAAQDKFFATKEGAALFSQKFVTLTKIQ